MQANPLTTINWFKSGKNKELQKAAAQKIEALRVFEKEVPSVFIIHDISDMSVVYMSERGLQWLGTTLEEIQLPNCEYHSRYFNPEDAAIYVPKIQGLLQRNTGDEVVTYFQQVRPSPEANWHWHLSSTRILLRDSAQQPVLIITIAVPVDTIHPFTNKVDRLLYEQAFLQRYKDVFESLTKREKEILKLMAQGVNSLEIAQKLHISEATANTHRRNIRSKINAQTNYDVTKFAQAFDLI